MLKKTILLTALLLFIQSGVKAQSPVLDSLFGSNAIISPLTAASGNGGLLLLQPDGKIILGGHHYTPGFVSAFIDLARFDVCGNLDTTFGTGGIVSVHFDSINTLLNMKLQSDGKILCVGIQAPSTAGSQQMAYVARLNANGTADTTFNHTGSFSRSFDNLSSGEFSGVDILPDGRILATGTCRANINGGQYAYAAMRFMPDGSVDTTFAGGLYLRRNVTNPIYNTTGHLLPLGKTVMATTIDNNGPVFLQVIRIDSNGVLDSSFATSGVYDDTKTYFTSSSSFATIDHNSNIVIAMQNNGGASTIIRLTPNGTLDVPFGTGGYVTLDPSLLFTPHRAAILDNGKIAIMGWSNNGPLLDGILLLDNNGSIDSTYGKNGVLVVPTQSSFLGVRGLVELPNSNLLLGQASTLTSAAKFTPQSNVPHITNNSGMLSTTGMGAYQWFLNSAPINGATQSTLTAPGDGSYAVMITDADGCSYLSDTVVVTGSGVKEMQEEIVSVFPNPASTHINILSPSPIKTIAIVNGLGETVMLTSGVDGSLDTRTLANGVYLVTIQLENNTIVTKKITIIK